MGHIQGKMYLLGAFSLAGTSVITGYILAIKLSSFMITSISLGIVLLAVLRKENRSYDTPSDKERLDNDSVSSNFRNFFVSYFFAFWR